MLVALAACLLGQTAAGAAAAVAGAAVLLAADAAGLLGRQVLLLEVAGQDHVLAELIHDALGPDLHTKNKESMRQHNTREGSS